MLFRIGAAFGVLLALLAAYVFFLWLSLPPERVSTYATYDEAETGDELTDHWIPEFLPGSAKGIRVRRGVDPSFMSLEFTFSPSDKASLTSTFLVVTDPEERARVVRRLRYANWETPPPAKVEVFVKKTNPDGRRSTFILLIDSLGSHAWYSED